MCCVAVAAICLLLFLLFALSFASLFFVCLFVCLVFVLFFFFLFFSLFFIGLHCTAYRLLVPQPGVRPGPLGGEIRVQDAGTPENS